MALLSCSLSSQNRNHVLILLKFIILVNSEFQMICLASSPHIFYFEVRILFSIVSSILTHQNEGIPVQQRIVCLTASCQGVVQDGGRWRWVRYGGLQK